MKISTTKIRRCSNGVSLIGCSLYNKGPVAEPWSTRRLPPAVVVFNSLSGKMPENPLRERTLCDLSYANAPTHKELRRARCLIIILLL